MVFMIIYLIGVVASITLFKEVFSLKTLSLWAKLGLSLYLLLFSWLGYFSYTLVIRVFLNRPKE